MAGSRSDCPVFTLRPREKEGSGGCPWRTRGASVPRLPNDRGRRTPWMKSERTKVLLADDHTIVREGILSLLQAHQDIVVVGTAENGQEAIEKARRSFPDTVVM